MKFKLRSAKGRKKRATPGQLNAQSPSTPGLCGVWGLRAGSREAEELGRRFRVRTRQRPGQARARASVPGLAHLFHLDLLVVYLFKVEDLGGGFDHLTGGRRGGGRSGGRCRHDPSRSPGGPGRLPPGQSGGDPRPPASGPTFNLEPRRSWRGQGQRPQPTHFFSC